MLSTIVQPWFLTFGPSAHSSPSPSLSGFFSSFDKTSLLSCFLNSSTDWPACLTSKRKPWEAYPFQTTAAHLLQDLGLGTFVREKRLGLLT